MSDQGTLFALSRDDAKRLFAQRTDEALRKFGTEELSGPSLQLDDWSAMHRCLGDGTLSLQGGEYPLNHCLLGGRQLYKGDDWIISLKRPDMTPHIAKALKGISREELRTRYRQLDAADDDSSRRTDCQSVPQGGDFEAVWKQFEAVREFYEQATQQQHAVLFVVNLTESRGG